MVSVTSWLQGTTTSTNNGNVQNHLNSTNPITTATTTMGGIGQQQRRLTNTNQQQQNDSKSNNAIAELVKVLYPTKGNMNGSSSNSNSSSSFLKGGKSLSSSITNMKKSSSSSSSSTTTRFSQLLLDHGEKLVQDWAVVGYSQPIENHHKNSSTTTTSTTTATTATKSKRSMIQYPSKESNPHETTASKGSQQQHVQQQSNGKDTTKQEQKKKILWYQGPEYNSHKSSITTSSSSSTYSKRSTSNNGDSHQAQTTTTTTTTSDPHYPKKNSTNNNVRNNQQQQQRYNNQQQHQNSFGEYDMIQYPSIQMKNIQGRLYLCTNSLVFEPNDVSRGMIRCCFHKMDSGPPVSTTALSVSDDDGIGINTTKTSSSSSLHNKNNKNNSHRSGNTNSGGSGSSTSSSSNTYETLLSVHYTCRKHYVLKVDNRIGPYKLISVPCTFRFTFLHSSPNHFLELSHSLYNLYRANNSNSHNSNSHSKYSSHSTSSTPAPTSVTPIIHFDVSNFVDVREQIQTNQIIHCTFVQPLQSHTGIMVVTNERIYYQNIQQQYIYKYNMNHIVAIARRYSGLRDCALEIYFQDMNSSVASTTSTFTSSAFHYNGNSRKRTENSNTSSTMATRYSSVLFGFERRHDRELIIRCIQNGKSHNGIMHNNYQSQYNQNHDQYYFDNQRTIHNTVPCFTDREFVKQVVQEWMKGNISNYEYLLALNSAAGRSFHDLSRYPVFPWVIQDFTSPKLDLTSSTTFRDLSKPIGALNPDRLLYFQQRLCGMQDMDEAFLYGTHYSAPGYVLYYLVRSMPEHMLCLQNGKFDAPDRMFHSIEKCYHCVLTNHADVKELIPEFYNPYDDYDFLINTRNLQLGSNQTGERVNDVFLPTWAKSPRDYIKQNRIALECPYVSNMLPKWIDLIFGYTSRGLPAYHANNLFHQYSYLGPNDLASMPNEYDRTTAELQATEFGIVPDQLFMVEHPMKLYENENVYVNSEPQQVVVNLEELICPNIGRASQSYDSDGNNPNNYYSNSKEAWELLDVPNDNYSEDDILHNTPTTTTTNPHVDDNDHQHRRSDQIHHHDNNEHNSQQTNQQHQIQTHATTPDSHQHSTNQNRNSDTNNVPCAWDMKILERKQIHSDSISGCELVFDTDSNLSILTTTSLDGALKVHTVTIFDAQTPTNSIDDDNHKVQSNFGSNLSSTLSRISYLGRSQSVPPPPVIAPTKLSEYRTHTARDPLASLVVTSDNHGGTIAFVGGHDDIVLAYGIKSACAVASVYSHRDAVTGLDLIVRYDHNSTVLTDPHVTKEDDDDNAIWLKNSTHVMVSGSWDATVKVWSASVSSGETVAIHREPIIELFDADSSIVCVSAMKLLPNNNNHSNNNNQSEFRDNRHPYNDIDEESKQANAGGIVIAAGCADGSFCVWNLHNDGVQVLIHKEIPSPSKQQQQEGSRSGAGPCSVVRWVSSDSGQIHLFTAFATGKVASYTLVGGKLKRESAVSIGVPVLSFAYMKGLILVGGADGGIRLISIMDGIYFDSRPILWPAVHNKNTTNSNNANVNTAPGISSLHITYKEGSRNMGSASPSRRCICCSGGEDGSVVLFELKKVMTTTATTSLQE